MPNSTEHQAAVRPLAVPFPHIVAILGPASQVVQATCLAIELELQGRMTVMSHVRPPLDIADDMERWNTHYQPQLAAMARHRIEMADEVYVVGKDAELGEEIQAQIDYARSLRKPVVRHWTPKVRRVTEEASS